MTTTSRRAGALDTSRAGEPLVTHGHEPLTRAWYRLQALVDWERADRGAMRVDLAPELDLMTRLGQPHRRFRSVHVAGTKGKGSVCALIEAGLLNAGLRAGRYASPHIEHVTERVSHLGTPISESLFAHALTRALDARDAAFREGTAAREASWFDVVTGAAFWSFAEAKLDWVVIEVGLGGLLDSTNVVTPELAIVTNVDLEHTEVLGRTVEAIATQKAGIFKRGRPALTPVSLSTPAGSVIASTAAAIGADLRCVEVAESLGLHERNLWLSRAALSRLGESGFESPARGKPLGPEDLPAEAALRARLPGRMEVFDVTPLEAADSGQSGLTTRIVLDGAHVGFALTAALADLQREPAHARRPVVLLALAPDKDALDIIGRLRSIASAVVCTQLQGDRPSWDCTRLRDICVHSGTACQAIADPLQGLAKCLELVGDHSWILVTGSLHLVGSLRGHLCSR